MIDRRSKAEKSSRSSLLVARCLRIIKPKPKLSRPHARPPALESRTALFRLRPCRNGHPRESNNTIIRFISLIV